MARKPRIEFEGAFYHVISRGNHRQSIFKSRKDYERYLKLLTDYKRRYGYSLYAYVLLRNHVHLLIEAKKVPLSKILQGLQQSYTMYFNKKYGTVGHLFQGRYKAILCDRDDYLLSLVKYIHLNPVRAGGAKTPEEYEWSSHRFYLGKTEGRGVVDMGLVLGMFSEDRERARRAYRVFVGEKEGMKREEVYATLDQRILGDENFVEEVAERTGKEELVRVKRKGEYALPEIGAAVERVCGITLGQMRGKTKDKTVGSGRRAVSLLAREYGHKGQDIAGYLRKDPSVITRYLREAEKYVDLVEKVQKILREGR